MLQFSPQPELPSHRSTSLNKHIYRDFNIISNRQSTLHDYFKDVKPQAPVKRPPPPPDRYRGLR